MQLNLFDNAIDSILHGLEHYAEGNLNPRDYKFSILHVAQGVELLLKERLAREHWVLVFEKVDKPAAGERTVGFDGAIQRLEGICKVHLDKYKAGLQALKNARNEMEHCDERRNRKAS